MVAQDLPYAPSSLCHYDPSSLSSLQKIPSKRRYSLGAFLWSDVKQAAGMLPFRSEQSFATPSHHRRTSEPLNKIEPYSSAAHCIVQEWDDFPSGRSSTDTVSIHSTDVSTPPLMDSASLASRTSTDSVDTLCDESTLVHHPLKEAIQIKLAPLQIPLPPSSTTKVCQKVQQEVPAFPILSTDDSIFAQRQTAAKAEFAARAGLKTHRQRHGVVTSYSLSDDVEQELKAHDLPKGPTAVLTSPPLLMTSVYDSAIGDASPPVSPVSPLSPTGFLSFIDRCRRKSSSDSASNHSAPSSFRRSGSFRRKSSNSNSLSRKSSIRSISSVTSSLEVVSPMSAIPECLQEGTTMTKVTAKRQRQKEYWIDHAQGRLCWSSKRDKHINIDDIKEIRYGTEAVYYREQFKFDACHADRWLTIIHLTPESNFIPGRVKLLHLVAKTAEACEIWIDTLAKLIRARRDARSTVEAVASSSSSSSVVSVANAQDTLLQQWSHASSHRLSLEAVVQMCRKLNIHASKEELERRFVECDTDNTTTLDFVQFQQFVKLLKRRPEVSELFASLDRTGRGYLTLQEFHRFLVQEQKQYKGFDLADSEQARQVQDIYSKACSAFKVPHMTLDVFSRYLSSKTNSIVPQDQTRSVYQDMTRPLNEYFISSSHNTYLLGHQLKGQSSVEGYIRSLYLGCRCVELDCWDGPDGNPVIYHGHTLTTKILLSDVVKVIAKYAFLSTPYPLVLSLEVHCCIEQQEKMVQCFKDGFGSMLVAGPITDSDELPSPEQLKYQILIKSKTLKAFTAKVRDSSTSSSSNETDSERTSSEQTSPTLTPTLSRCSTISRESSVQLPHAENFEPLSRRSSLETTSATNRKKSFMKRGPRIGQALSDLAVYTGSVKYRGFFEEDIYRANEMFSLSERIFNRLYRRHRIAFRKHNQDHLTRIYPAAFRIGSYNFDPHHFWESGCQMVSLNWQTHDRGMQMQQAMFNDNGRSGYILKPARMRGRASAIKRPHSIKLEIISAQQLCKPRDSDKDHIDPLVEVELFVPEMGSTKKRTSMVSNNGFNPVWNQTLEFATETESLDLAFLKFDILDSNANGASTVASYCIRISNLQQGYRYIPLSDQNGEQLLFSTLYIRATINTTDILP